MHIDVSVIIVNYNVKTLLEQTISSVKNAIGNLKVEIIVVDNNSVDGSVAMLRDRFEDVKIIENKVNVGFSKANNQGIAIAKGRNLLILNPDTVLSENALTEPCNFLDNNSDVGALGVKMIDGSGNFLPESKRGLPTPKVAFYKMLGLSKLFPNSKEFGKYHLSYLDKDETNEVEILSGAFMFIKKEVIDKVGGFDETFFMYGEDIDLSYRILKAGYKNYYLANTTIIHYKGESTKKNSVNYVRIFYQAMGIFAKKHFSERQGYWFNLAIQLSIFIRAFIALSVRVLKTIGLYLLDFIVIYLGYFGATQYWEVYNRYVVGGSYPKEYYYLHIPAYIVCWIIGISIKNGYKQWYRIFQVAAGVVFGTILLLILYALLPEQYRYSRALIVLGASWALISTVAIRLLVHFIKFKHFDTQASQQSQVVIVGSIEECERVRVILSNHSDKFKLIGYIYPKKDTNEQKFIGNLSNLDEIIEIYKVNEVIFCAKDISSTEIMHIMSFYLEHTIRFKIIPEKGYYIIGSDNKNANGEFYSIDITPTLGSKNSRIKKRIFDLFICISFPILLPFLIYNFSFLKKYISNWLACFLGKKTWIGYAKAPKGEVLPPLKDSVFGIEESYNRNFENKNLLTEMNLLYAQKYRTLYDLEILLKIFLLKPAQKK